MNYWHIQLFPGTGNKAKFPSEKIREILKQTHYIGIGEEWHDTTEGQFKNALRIGDIVLVRSSGPLALCKVIGDWEHKDDIDPDFDWFPNRRKIEILGWIEDYAEGIAKPVVDGITYPTSFGSANNSNFVKNWYSTCQRNSAMEIMQKLLTENKNLILTGAPGTGKTYLSKQIAKQMIGIATDEELEKSGQFRFVQFHPSYDYTDFVEGLRPTKPDANGNVGFELRDGAFKDFCKKAIAAIAVEHIDKFTLDDYVKYLQTIGLNEKTISSYKNRIEQLLGKELKAKKQIVDRETYSSLGEICNNIDDIKDFDAANNFHYQFFSAVSNLISFRDGLSSKQHSVDKNKASFIFIIDEINRGEISKIFGELFFSIDPSYRGKKGAVKTQYSNMHEGEDEVFYVPENVYVIGTMNDIDRSVESFDFAMRRRFAWHEITAEQSAESMNLPEEVKSRMAKLNAAISKIDGLNASYHVGGAYFLDKDGKPRTDYKNIWELRLEPLLKEYVRGMPDTDTKLQDLEKAYNA